MHSSIVRLITVAAAAFGVVAMAAPARAAGPAPLATSPGAIAAKPSQFLGKTVEVRSEVEAVFGPRTFTLDEDRIGAGPDVLVLLPQAARRPIRDDTDVVVTGVVRTLILADIEREYGEIDLAPEVEVELRGRPVIIADSIRTEDGQLLFRSDRPKRDRPSGRGGMEQGSGASGRDEK